MKKIIKTISYGALIWLIPFIVSFPVYKALCSYDITLFKTVMIMTGAVSSVPVFYLNYRPVTENYLKNALLIGLIWFAVNIVLDLIILVPMDNASSKILYGVFEEYKMVDMALKVSSIGKVTRYFFHIGLRYIYMITLALTAGLLFKAKTKNS